MKQFTEEQLAAARQKVTPAILAGLIEGNSDVINSDTLVPETGCATWNHYYFCPEHSVRLLWNRHSPNAHRCPVDGAIFTGEPYSGAWWRWLNGLNAKASYELSLLWLLTGETRYRDKVIDILLHYARYYPDYQEHGGIPYNGPGKANAQTLCEANCHTDFARGFDLIRSALSAEQEAYIATRLLRCGAEFLMRHRSNQIHNHEVKISAAVGIIGAVLDDKSYLEFAVRSPYGLLYQLEHALLPGGLWFEGSLHYHYYALEAFFAFEKLAKNGEYSLLDLPFYAKMLSLPITLLMPDMTLPKVNDCVNGQERPGHADIYEFAYFYYGKKEYGQWLSSLYRTAPRSHMDALLYGQPLPAETLPIPAASRHDPDAGFTLIRNAPGRAVCIKHGPYGGEHDHYDRLNLIVFTRGNALFPDLGTTGYGAPLHYGYYKNSFSHNTLCVNGLNQPPAAPRVMHYEEQPGFTRLVCEVDWKTPAPLPDSKTRVEWDEASYRDVVFRRSVQVTQNLLIDRWDVENPHAQRVDAINLLRADALPGQPQAGVSMCYPHVRQAHAFPLNGQATLRYRADEAVAIRCFSPHPTDVIQAVGPDNPSTSELQYVVLRSRETRICWVIVTDLSGEGEVNIDMREGEIIVTDGRTDQRYRA